MYVHGQTITWMGWRGVKSEALGLLGHFFGSKKGGGFWNMIDNTQCRTCNNGVPNIKNVTNKSARMNVSD